MKISLNRGFGATARRVAILSCTLAGLLSTQAFCAIPDSLHAPAAKQLTAAPADSTAKPSALPAKDTATASIAARSPDSAHTSLLQTPNDSSLKKNTLQKKSLPPLDTTSRFLKTPFVSFGIGWALGSYDIFNSWQNNLPDSVQKILPLNPDTMGFSIIEPVNTYNILFPVSVSYTPFVNARSSVSLEASFCYIGKTLQVTMQRDTNSGKINYRQSMNSYTFAAGVLYRHALDERYFRIEGVDRTSILAGAYVLPYSYLSNETSITWTGVPDSVVSAAKRNLQSFYAWGYGAGWRVGITTQRALSQNSGMEVSICYVGRYLGSFREKSRSLTNADIDASSSTPATRVSFLSNTVEIRLEFCLGTSPAPKKP
jgi:hypothetical protein